MTRGLKLRKAGGSIEVLYIEQAARLSDDPQVRFAALLHDLGKGTTPPGEWPRHHGHEARSVELVSGLCARLKVPVAYRQLAIAVARSPAWATWAMPISGTAAIGAAPWRAKAR